jgi:hypothetical protein
MNHLDRTIDACRDAGLPVVNKRDCTCGLRGRLVVLARAAGLEVMWPYDRRCPTHGLRDPMHPGRLRDRDGGGHVRGLRRRRR